MQNLTNSNSQLSPGITNKNPAQTSENSAHDSLRKPEIAEEVPVLSNQSITFKPINFMGLNESATGLSKISNEVTDSKSNEIKTQNIQKTSSLQAGLFSGPNPFQGLG